MITAYWCSFPGGTAAGKALTEGGGGGVRRLDPQVHTVLVFLLSGSELVGGGNRAAGKAPVRIAIRADVPSAVASGRRALQYRLVHRQYWVHA